MEEELHRLFVEKRAIGRKINAKWIHRNAQIIYGNRYPHRVVRVEGSRHHTLDLPFPMVGLQASYSEKGYLFVSVFSLLFIYKYNSFIGSYKESTSCPYRLLRKMPELVTI
jgi:hypothetical protein